MYPGQKLSINGIQVALFPMQEMYLTQGEYGSVSHDLAMDFQGWSNGQRVYNCPYYAPFDCVCVDSGGSGENYRVFESYSDVLCPDNIRRFVTFVVMHDNNPIANVGDFFAQGDLIGHTGTARPEGTEPIGDHLHLNTAYGHYAGWSPTTHGSPYYELTNSSHIYNTLFINNTTRVVDGGYLWSTFIIPPIPVPTRKSKFPWWILQNRKHIIGQRRMS